MTRYRSQRKALMSAWGGYIFRSADSVLALARASDEGIGNIDKMTEPQQLALGARLIYQRLRGHVDDKKPFALACIRLQTFYGKPTP